MAKLLMIELVGVKLLILSLLFEHVSRKSEIATHYQTRVNARVNSNLFVVDTSHIMEF